ncbi:hypothetical protein HDZ31DRAFT_31207 [Schizophyllum fasciatum]
MSRLEYRSKSGSYQSRDQPCADPDRGLFARIRSINGLAINTLSSLFAKGSSYSIQNGTSPTELRLIDDQQALSSNRLLESRAIFQDSRNGTCCVDTSPARSAHLSTGQRASARLRSPSSGSDLDLTPPLTPDNALHSPSFDQERRSSDSPTCAGTGGFYFDISLPSHAPDIREGKKPERFPDLGPLQDQSLCSQDSPSAATADDVDGSDEWVGLEYSIELSTRERHISDSLSHASGGEHSKSRESWAALHAGTMPPIVEDQEYARWLKWHRYLDQQDERRRHKKAYAFKAHARDMALLYLEEFRLRDVMHKTTAHGPLRRDWEQRLALVMKLRPDPYHPPQRHTDSWYLKRTRSLSCLAELQM